MRTRRNLAIDTAVFSAYLLAANPATTGIPVHEWLSIGFLVTGLVHHPLHRDWVARALTGRLARSSRALLALDAVTAIAAGTVIVSGLAVSRTLSALAHITVTASPTWTALHGASATALAFTAAAHLALHWRWIAAAVRLHVARPVADWFAGAPLQRAATAVAVGVPAVLAACLIALAALGGANTASARGFDPRTASSTTTTGATLTCPRTGCTASTCHATTGASPYARGTAPGSGS